jgi:hypothetical protein
MFLRLISGSTNWIELTRHQGWRPRPNKELRPGYFHPAAIGNENNHQHSGRNKRYIHFSSDSLRA